MQEQGQEQLEMLEGSALLIALGMPMPLNGSKGGLTLERSITVVTAISNPLGSEEPPGQHKLEQPTKGTAIRGFSNFGLLNSAVSFTDIEYFPVRMSDLRSTWAQ